MISISTLRSKWRCNSCKAPNQNNKHSTDYTEIVKSNLLADWGLKDKETEAALLAVMGGC